MTQHLNQELHALFSCQVLQHSSVPLDKLIRNMLLRLTDQCLCVELIKVFPLYVLIFKDQLSVISVQIQIPQLTIILHSFIILFAEPSFQIYRNSHSLSKLILQFSQVPENSLSISTAEVPFDSGFSINNYIHKAKY